MRRASGVSYFQPKLSELTSRASCTLLCLVPFTTFCHWTYSQPPSSQPQIKRFLIRSHGRSSFDSWGFCFCWVSVGTRLQRVPLSSKRHSQDGHIPWCSFCLTTAKSEAFSNLIGRIPQHKELVGKSILVCACTCWLRWMQCLHLHFCRRWSCWANWNSVANSHKSSFTTHFQSLQVGGPKEREVRGCQNRFLWWKRCHNLPRIGREQGGSFRQLSTHNISKRQSAAKKGYGPIVNAWKGIGGAQNTLVFTLHH